VVVLLLGGGDRRPSEATFIDSSILNVFVMAKRGRQPIALVVPPGGAARRLFDLVHLDDAISTYETRAAALTQERSAEGDQLAEAAPR
jgi:anti-anti-sigma regulatory factor